MDAEIYTRDHGLVHGQYLFTIDNYHANLDVIDNNERSASRAQIA